MGSRPHLGTSEGRAPLGCSPPSAPPVPQQTPLTAPAAHVGGPRQPSKLHLGGEWGGGRRKGRFHSWPEMKGNVSLRAWNEFWCFGAEAEAHFLCATARSFHLHGDFADGTREQLAEMSACAHP